MRKLLAILTALAIGVGPALAADVASVRYSETSDGALRMMRQTTSFVIPAGQPLQKTFAVGAPAAVLKGVLLTSTDCTNCDIVISITTGTGATGVVYEEQGGASRTVNGVAYTHYIAAAPDLPAVFPAADTEYIAFVRVINGDVAERTCTVSLIWGTA